VKHKILIEQTVQNITILINTTEISSETQNTNRTNSTKHHYPDKHNRNT
jgi:hypothetical protein